MCKSLKSEDEVPLVEKFLITDDGETSVYVKDINPVGFIEEKTCGCFSDGNVAWFEKLKLKYSMIDTNVDMLLLGGGIYANKMLGHEKQVGVQCDTLNGTEKLDNMQAIVLERLANKELEFKELAFLYVGKVVNTTLRIDNAWKVDLKTLVDCKVYIEKCSVANMFYNQIINSEVYLGYDVKRTVIDMDRKIENVTINVKMKLSRIKAVHNNNNNRDKYPTIKFLINDESIRDDKDIQWIIKMLKETNAGLKMSEEAGNKVMEKLGGEENEQYRYRLRSCIL